MAGEKILIADSSASVQELAKAVLEEHGYKLATASNGVAALAHPDLENFSLIILDSMLDGMDGLETTAQIRTDAETYGIPVLLLFPEDQIEERASQSLRGANGFIAKPFKPNHLAIKVREILEEQRLKRVSEEYLEKSAEDHMQSLAEQKIQKAVEKKIQIIVERAIQSIVSIIDQRAKREVDARVTALTAEKEQELVRLTVQEVARSMVEKMAEKKVEEAMEAILVDTTEKTVKRAADTMLPSLVRERLKESMDSMLPREIQTKVDKAAQEKTNEYGEALISVLQSEAKKTVPMVAKERLPEIAERQVANACEEKIPNLVNQEARGAVANELDMRIQPMIENAFKKIKNLNYTFIGIIAFVLIVSFVLAVLFVPQYIDNRVDTYVERRLERLQ